MAQSWTTSRRVCLFLSLCSTASANKNLVSGGSWGEEWMGKEQGAWEKMGHQNFPRLRRIIYLVEHGKLLLAHFHLAFTVTLAVLYRFTVGKLNHFAELSLLKTKTFRTRNDFVSPWPLMGQSSVMDEKLSLFFAPLYITFWQKLHLHWFWETDLNSDQWSLITDH